VQAKYKRWQRRFVVWGAKKEKWNPKTGPLDSGPGVMRSLASASNKNLELYDVKFSKARGTWGRERLDTSGEYQKSLVGRPRGPQDFIEQEDP